MAKTCIKCGYTRRDSDTGPDYSCPACGVVYAKAEAAHAQQVVAKAKLASIADRAPAPAIAPAATGNAKADAMIQQLMAAQAAEKRTPNPYRGMALVALIAFALGFAAAAGMYSVAAKMSKSLPSAANAANCRK